MTDIPVETPLTDLLARVPEDAVASYEHSPTHHQHIPYGHLCHRALAEIEQMEERHNEDAHVIEFQGEEIERLQKERDGVQWRHEETYKALEISQQQTRDAIAEIERLNARIAELENDLSDALDLKNGCGPTVLTALTNERESLKAEVERLTSYYAGADAALAEDRE